MVKVIQVQAVDPETKEIDVVLKSDTKAEVTDSVEIVGLPEGYTIGFNSYILTASGELAIRTSEGEWNWIE